MFKVFPCLLFSLVVAEAQPLLDFARDVHPVLAQRCFACHSGDKRSGGLSLGEYSDILQGGRSGAAVTPGNSKQSLLMLRITGEHAPQMPLGGPKLTDAETATIRTWIDQGVRPAANAAPAKQRWMPQMALHAPEIPTSVWQGWTSPADRLLANYLAAAKVPQPQVVPDRLFARRAYLDIWGMVPTPEQLDAFLTDNSPDKRGKLVRQLLAENRNYSEHWISFWNDLLRNDEGADYHGGRKSISAWLLNALETDLPYNQMVSKLLNPVAPTDPDGFLVGVNWRGDVSASQVPSMQAAQNSAQVFLGVNLKCNSCHDSFISRWKLKDAYGLAAYFAADEKLPMFRCDRPTGQFATAQFLYPELDKQQAVPSTLSERHAAAARLFTSPENGRVPRTFVNRIWQRLIGRGLVEPVDDMDVEPWDPALLDWLSADFVAHGCDIKHLIATIMESKAYQMASTTTEVAAKDYVFRGPQTRRMSAEQFVDSLSEITGEWRVMTPRDRDATAAYVREWRMASSPLTRALGRPIRDQVFTERNNEATMLQALEMVNGETLTHALNRGAARMLGEVKPAPRAVYDSGQLQHGEHSSATLDIDISGAKELWLLVSDRGSYAPERVRADWADIRLESPRGATMLADLKPRKADGLRTDTDPIGFVHGDFKTGIRSLAESTVVYDIAGRGLTRLRGTVGIEKSSMLDEIMPAVRFFVFDREPDRQRLLEVAPETPVETVRQGPVARGQIVDRLFVHALGRKPNEAERKIAQAAIADPKRPGEICANGVADVLWSLAMLPEFQMIR